MEKNNLTQVKECSGNPFLGVFKLFISVILVLLSVAMVQAEEEIDKSVLENASALLQQKNPQAAYRLLEKYEDEYAGWWEYDYLLGVAALESGKSNLAIFALQRSLAMNPNLMGAHVDLGRAYFEVNELVPAKAEFEIVLKNKPIKKVKNIANSYLRLIENRSSPVRFHSKYYLETVGGYDSNANSATEEKTFNGFTLSSENVKTPSTYVSLKVGTSMFIKMNKKNSFSLSANLTQRENQHIDNVNFINGNANVAWNYRHKYAEQTIGAQFSKTDVAESFQTYATTANFGLKFRLIIDAYLQLNGSFTNLMFSESQPDKDSIQTMFGASLSKPSKKINVPSINIALFLGENVPRGSQKTNGKTITGGRVGLQQRVKWRLPVFVNLSSGVMYSIYKEQQFEKYRADVLVDLILSASVRPWKYWEISLKTAGTKNKSNIDLYQYIRINNALSIRRYF